MDTQAQNTSIPYKSRLIAGLLQIFLGLFAAGRFYLGDKDYAYTQVQNTVVTFGIGIIWPIIDGFALILGAFKETDLGIPLKL